MARTDFTTAEQWRKYKNNKPSTKHQTQERDACKEKEQTHQPRPCFRISYDSYQALSDV